MTICCHRQSLGLLGAVFFLLMFAGFSELRADQKLPELTVLGETYKDVTVTSKSHTDLFITHSGGFANIKVEHLDSPTRVLLGYESAKPQRKLPANLPLPELSGDRNVEEVRQQMAARFDEQFGDINPNYIIAAAIAIFGVFYLFMCFCFHCICKKAGTEPGLVVWLPILQMFPLLKAAGMPAWWFFVFLLSSISPLIAASMINTMGPSPVLFLAFVPHLLTMVGSIIWCFKIFQARGMSAWLGIFLLLPVTNIFAFLYLAFGSSPVYDVAQRERAKTERWSKSRAQDTSYFLNS